MSGVVSRVFLALSCASGASCGAAPTGGPGPTIVVGPTGTGTASVEPAPDDTFRCDGTPFKVGNHEYCAHTGPRTWTSARQACKAEGGDLASFDSPDEGHDFFVAVGPPIGAAEAVWFGLEEPRPGAWTWIDGTALGASHWNQGEPNNDGGQEHCAEWKLGPGSWNDAPCTSLRPYVCGQPLSSAPAPAKPAPKCSGQSIHTTAGDYCFHLRNRKSWADARAACASEGSALAVLPTAQADKLLHDAVGPKVRSSSLWIGLTDAEMEGEWQWVSGQSSRYDRWKYGEPNDFGGGESCAEWFPDDGQMNDLDCQSKRPFLCEHTTPGPAKPPIPKNRSYGIRGPE